MSQSSGSALEYKAVTFDCAKALIDLHLAHEECDELLWKERLAQTFPVYYPQVVKNYCLAYKYLTIIPALRYDDMTKPFLSVLDIKEVMESLHGGLCVSMIHPLCKLNLVKTIQSNLLIKPKMQISSHNDEFIIHHYPGSNIFGNTPKVVSAKAELLHSLLIEVQKKGFMCLPMGYNRQVLCPQQALQHPDLIDLVIEAY